jgi:PKD repeat protein
MISGYLRRSFLATTLLISACGGGGSSSSAPPAPVNTSPTANFAYSCADLVCSFTSTSTDQDVGDAIASYVWTFGDASTAASTAAPSHTFAAGGTYTVSLTVGDRAGATNQVSRQVTVTAPAMGAAPRASFTAACISLDCTFTDTSTYDSGSVFQSRSWDFGDGASLPTTNPATHRYAVAAVTTYPVKLTVADANGKTSTSVQSIVVAPSATVNLALTQASRVTATILSSSCGATNNQIVVTAPIRQTAFANGCFDPVGTPVQLNGNNVFAAGTVLQVEVLSGTLGSSILVSPPTIRITGDFANGWTLTFDDGYGGPGEPDFNDLVVLIKPAP